MNTGILFLIDELALGGTEKQLMELVRYLDRNRFQPHLCTLRAGSRMMVGQMIPNLCLNFVAFHHPGTVRSISELSRYVREHRIGIVQSFFQDPMLMAALSATFHSARLVGSFRDLGFWRSRKETFKMRLAYLAFDGFIANSESVKTHFVKTDRIEPCKIEVIHNGIDITGKPGTHLATPVDCSPIVGIVANLNRPVKRVQDFIKAAARVHGVMPETRFIVVGDGALRPELEELSRSLHLAEALTFTGLIQNPSDYIARFHVGVITSETEGFCNAILEYMACGVPAVATATGGNIELVRDGKSGFLVPVGNIEELARRIVLLLRGNDMRAAMRDYSLRIINREYSMAKMVTRHESYYGRLLNR